MIAEPVPQGHLLHEILEGGGSRLGDANVEENVLVRGVTIRDGGVGTVDGGVGAVGDVESVICSIKRSREITDKNKMIIFGI